jgi:hypothetical protein
MAEYRIEARVTAQVVMTIEADNEAEARRKFGGSISIQAGLVPEGFASKRLDYVLEEDFITNVDRFKVYEA